MIIGAIMKKTVLVMILSITMFIQIGCSNASSTTTSQFDEIETTSNQLDELGYQVEILNYEDPYFDVTINSVVIDVAYRKIYVDYSIESFSTSYDYYFVYGFEAKDFRPFHNMPSKEKKASGIYELNLIFNENDPSGYMTVEMGRYSSGVTVNKEYPETNSAGFKYWIKDIEDRGSFSKKSVYIYSNDNVTTDAEISCSIEDPDEIIQSIKFVLTDPLSGNTYIDELIVPVTEDMRNDDKIIYHDISFHGLTIGMRYQVNVYVSGFDGLYDFTDSLIDHAQTVID
jgi:hypothetical protein